MNRKSFFIVTSVCAALASMAVGCGPGTNTTYRDFLTAIGTVFQADGRTPLTDLAIDSYNWVITFTDGSSVSNPFVPSTQNSTMWTTNATGQFTFTSDQLALTSGTQVESCTQVCLDWATGYNDVCTDWQTSSEDYCADWEVDSDGNDYCADWETSYTDYCANWGSESYLYCDLYGQDCGWIYPARAIEDIASAYSEINYTDGASTVTTQSSGTVTPANAISTSKTTAGHDIVVDDKWTQQDNYVTNYTQLSASKAKIVTARNTSKMSSRKILKNGIPHFGRTHAVAKVMKDKFSVKQQAKIDAARTGCGAYPKSLQ